MLLNAMVCGLSSGMAAVLGVQGNWPTAALVVPGALLCGWIALSEGLAAPRVNSTPPTE